jgi:FkbM family methyltransferase
MIMQKLVVIDVGAAIGEFSQHVLSYAENVKVFAIEPNLEMNSAALEALKTEFGKNFSIHYYALGEKSGIFPFFGSSQLNGQVGSLNKFNPEKKWDVYLENTIDKGELFSYNLVSVKSVAEFLSEINQYDIDFLKIDAQGSDVEILEQFLKFSSIKCMVLEVNTTSDKSENIYDGNNNLNTLMKVISKYNLNIIKITPNADFSELNVFLAKDMKVGQDILSYLKLSESVTFKRGWNVAIKSTSAVNSQIDFNTVVFKLFRLSLHPIKSLRKISRLLIS